MNVTESYAFKEVAEVIGEEKALEELTRVFPNGMDKYEVNDHLVQAFAWDLSPQGESFWIDIYTGVNPYTK
jgi:hypothetical protein